MEPKIVNIHMMNFADINPGDIFLGASALVGQNPSRPEEVQKVIAKILEEASKADLHPKIISLIIMRTLIDKFIDHVGLTQVMENAHHIENDRSKEKFDA